MTTTTTHYGLHLYNSTTDASASFIDFRMNLAGNVDAAGSGSSNMVKIDNALYDLVKLDGTRIMTGNLISGSSNGQIIISGSNASGGMEIGKLGRLTSGSPFIDFHSSVNSPDYDSRIIASGGSSSYSGCGNLNLYATNIYKNASEAISGKVGVTMFIDGGDEVITSTTDDKVTTEAPYNCSITSYALTSTDGTSGSISVVIEKATYANFPSTFTSLGTLSIIGSTKNSGSLAWSLSDGEIMRARVSGSPTNIKKLGISLKGLKT